MTKYQKKPVTVEAWKLNRETSTVNAPAWVRNLYVTEKIFYSRISKSWKISTLEGIIDANDGDYLVLGDHEEEIWSVRHDIFEETYVKVANTDRISPDDIGNDTHEFLHGGDK